MKQLWWGKDGVKGEIERDFCADSRGGVETHNLSYISPENPKLI